MRRFLLSLAGILGVTVMAIAADKVEEGKPAPLVELSAASKTKGAKVNWLISKVRRMSCCSSIPKP